MTRIHRSASSGRFVSAEDAAADPERHVAEAVEPRRPAMLPVREERMSDALVKWHLGPGVTGNAMVLHRFSGPDMGPHHDHPFPCRSYILYGGYSEEVLHPDGRVELRQHRPRDVVDIPHDHVHRIVSLHEGEAVTLYEVLGPKVQEPGFYEWRDGRMWSRLWHENEWTPL